jgi:hypothetical protein
MIETESLQNILRPEQVEIWKGRFEAGSKLALLFLAVIYGVGFLIVNIYSRKLGFANTGLLRPEYIVVGMLWFFLLGVTYGSWIVASNLIRSIWNEIGRLSGILIRALARLIAVLLSLVVFYMAPAVTASVLGTGGLTNSATVVVVIDLAITLVAVYSIKKLMQDAIDYFNKPHPPTDYRHYLRVAAFGEVPFRILFVLIAITAYSRAAFPTLDAEYGGGRPRNVNFIIKNEHRQSFVDIGFAIPENSRLLEGQVVLFEGPDYVLISPPTDRTKQMSALKISKDLVDITIYKPQE